MFSDLVNTWMGAQTNTPSKTVARSNSLNHRVWEVPSNTEKKKSLKRLSFVILLVSITNTGSPFPIVFYVISNVTKNGRTIYASIPFPNRIQMSVCKRAFEHV